MEAKQIGSAKMFKVSGIEYCERCRSALLFKPREISCISEYFLYDLKWNWRCALLGGCYNITVTELFCVFPPMNYTCYKDSVV